MPILMEDDAVMGSRAAIDRDEAARTGGDPVFGFGLRVYGAAATLLGVVGLAWGDFINVWQPVPDGLPGRTALAYVVGALLVAAGVALQFRQTARPAGALLAVLYLAFGLLWLQRVVAYPTIFATWGGVAEQVATAVGGLLAYLRSGRHGSREVAARWARIAFGVCAVAFGLNHFLNLEPTAGMVPAWIPPSAMFWAVATGIAHAAGGVAIIVGVRARLAAYLLAAMFATFGLLVWLPTLLADPAAHVAWAGNAVNLALVGAAWIVADSYPPASPRVPPSAQAAS